MNIICSQAQLNKALITVSKAITNRTTIPILKGILIETIADNRIRLTATDSEISIEKECECEVTSQGSTVVSSKLFTEMVKKLNSGDINITDNEGIVNIKCRSYSSDIAALPAEEFPDILKVEETERIAIDKNTFRKMVRRTSFAASTDDSRGIITGVLIECKDNVLSMVALDGFRMSIARESFIFNHDFKMVISARILNEVTKIISDEDKEDEIVIIPDSKKAVFTIGTTRITARLLEGSYMDYQSIIPKMKNSSLKVDRQSLVETIERASLVSSKNNLIKFNVQDNTATVSSRSEEGKIQEEISVYKEGENIEIGFNSKYLLDAVKAIDDVEVSMDFISNINPCMIKPVDGDDSFEFMILPVRI